MSLTETERRELEEYESKYRVLFEQPGWKQLVEDLNKEIYQLQADALEASSWDRLNEYKGRAYAYAYIINMPTMLATARQSRETEDEAANADLQLPL